MSNQLLNQANCEPEQSVGLVDNANTRDDLRTTCVLPLTALFVRPDGMLLNDSRAGFSKNLSPGGIEFELSGTGLLVSSALVLGLECPGGGTRFAGVANRHGVPCATGLRRGGDFSGVAHAMLEQSARVPVLNNDLFRFEMQFSEAIYRSWEIAGVLKRTVLDRVLLCPKCRSVLDRVLLCPKCRSVPTFRFECRGCGAGRLNHHLLIHHYACAYVGPAEQFESSEKSLVCPKCRTKHLTVGTDFEYAPAEFHCDCCGWLDRDLEQTGHCLSCEHRFPIHQSVEEELVGYDVERLDPLALIADLG